MVVFTSICCNYAHKARTLAESVKDNIPNATFVVCLLEREIPPIIEYPYFDHIVLAKDTWDGNFDQFIFKHTIVEAATSVKAQFFLYLQKAFPEEEKFIYLDPDIFAYDDFTEIRTVLDTRPILLCPHLLQPGNIDMELSSTAHGTFNLGFLAVNRSTEAKKFLNWWAERLSLYCYDDIPRGIFTDQKWIDLTPCFFDVEIFKHKGYNFATWSLLDCNITEEEGRFFVNGEPLRFIHYSGYGETLRKCIKDWLPEGDHPFKKLYENYSVIHDQNDSDQISKTPWSYAVYITGKKIDDKVRKLYRENEYMEVEDPFTKSNMYFRTKSKMIGIGNFKKNISKAWSIIHNEGIKCFFQKLSKIIFK